MNKFSTLVKNDISINFIKLGGVIMYYDEFIEEIALSINTKSIIWDTSILRNILNPFPLSDDPYEDNELLCFLLNKRIVTCEASLYKKAKIPDRNSNLFDEYKKTPRRGNREDTWTGWNWLLQQGADKIVPENQGSILYAASLWTYLKVGAGRPKRIFDTYLLNGHSYVHMPYPDQINILFKFIPGEEFENFHNKRKKEREEIIKLYIG